MEDNLKRCDFIKMPSVGSQFTGLHRAVRRVRPVPHAFRSVQPLDLRWRHALGAGSQVGALHVCKGIQLQTQRSVDVCFNSFHGSPVRSQASRGWRGGPLVSMRSSKILWAGSSSSSSWSLNSAQRISGTHTHTYRERDNLFYIYKGVYTHTH